MSWPCDPLGTPSEASPTRRTLDRADASAIAEAFGLPGTATLSGPIARGEQGRVWRLVVGNRSWAVKETFNPLTEESADGIARFQEAAQRVGVPAPSVARTTDGRAAATVDGVVVRVNGWVDLLPPDPRIDPVAVGRIVASIHALGDRGTAPTDPWYTEPVGAERWHALAAALQAANGPHAATLTAMVDELTALEELLEPPTDVVTCHRDLWADNLLPTASGGVCVIDWDNCGDAGPGQELAKVLFEFGGDDPGRTRALYGAYVEAGGPGRVRRRADFSLLIAELGHIGEMVVATWLDPATPAGDRDRAPARIGEFVSASLSRARIDRVLTAIGGIEE